jgi:nitroreductase
MSKGYLKLEAPSAWRVFMSLVDVLLSRRSIRRYEQKEISRDVLDKILEAGRQAPSAANKQPWHFIVVTDSEIKKEFSKRDVQQIHQGRSCLHCRMCP